MKKIKLTQGQYAIVDESDFNKLSKLKWFAVKKSTGFYAVRNLYLGNGKSRPYYMHQFLMKPPKGKYVDHKDHNTLNNCRSNLRVCSPLESARNKSLPKNNTSGYKGVSWNRTNNSWVANIKVGSKMSYLGMFATKFAAAYAYDKSATKNFGEFSKLNFPAV